MAPPPFGQRMPTLNFYQSTSEKPANYQTWMAANGPSAGRPFPIVAVGVSYRNDR